jgi:hypothetical protein
VLNAFHELGVCGEGIERFRMVALDVPPTADLARVQKLLNHGQGVVGRGRRVHHRTVAGYVRRLTPFR